MNSYIVIVFNILFFLLFKWGFFTSLCRYNKLPATVNHVISRHTCSFFHSFGVIVCIASTRFEKDHGIDFLVIGISFYLVDLWETMFINNSLLFSCHHILTLALYLTQLVSPWRQEIVAVLTFLAEVPTLYLLCFDILRAIQERNKETNSTPISKEKEFPRLFHVVSGIYTVMFVLFRCFLAPLYIFSIAPDLLCGAEEEDCDSFLVRGSRRILILAIICIQGMSLVWGWKLVRGYRCQQKRWKLYAKTLSPQNSIIPAWEYLFIALSTLQWPIHLGLLACWIRRNKKDAVTMETELGTELCKVALLILGE